MREMLVRSITRPAAKSIRRFAGTGRPQQVFGTFLTCGPMHDHESADVKFQAILWDCDGVLIDSELLACKVVADCYTRAGYSLTASEYIERFFGQSRAQVAATIRQETGEDLATNIDWTQVDAARMTAFEVHLQAVAGVTRLLQQASARKLLMAVASGSGLERLEHSLKLTGLWDLLAPHIYSTEQVTRGKPAPDIYLFAADKLGVSPSHCLVIEDTEHGTLAGKAAGMTVYGFTGGSHCSPGLGASLQQVGADAVFSDMPSLEAALGL
jgi:HAD superfamily hydrolase (TIGR01509 family)